MTPFLVAALLFIGTRLSTTAICAAGASVLAIQSAPWIAVPLGAGWPLMRLRKRSLAARREAAKQGRDVAALAELTAIALTGGLGIRRSLEVAGETVGGPVGGEVAAVLNRMRIEGSAALAAVDGIASPLYRTLARAASSGAPPVESMSRLAEHLRSEQAAAREQAVRRLPVVMLFPLTLLILPGFVLLTVAPALLDAFGRLEI